jgi:hypothetical protein
MTTSKQHRDAQLRLYKILTSYYAVRSLEAFTPTPSGKYIFDNRNEEFSIKPYLLDVYASCPYDKKYVTHEQIGIEVDGKVNHKTTKRQFQRDIQRTKDIICHFPQMAIFRFNTKDLIGRGYVNPKTKKRHSISTDEEIMKELGLKHPHI